MTLPTPPSSQLRLHLLVICTPHRYIGCLASDQSLGWVPRRTLKKSEESFTHFRFSRIDGSLKSNMNVWSLPSEHASLSNHSEKTPFVYISFKTQSSYCRTNRNYYMYVTLHKLIPPTLFPVSVFHRERHLPLSPLHRPTGYPLHYFLSSFASKSLLAPASPN